MILLLEGAARAARSGLGSFLTEGNPRLEGGRTSEGAALLYDDLDLRPESPRWRGSGETGTYHPLPPTSSEPVSHTYGAASDCLRRPTVGTCPARARARARGFFRTYAVDDVTDRHRSPFFRGTMVAKPLAAGARARAWSSTTPGIDEERSS